MEQQIKGRRNLRRRAIGVGAAILLATCTHWLIADAVKPQSTAKPQSTPDQVQFSQKTVEAQMQELQDRMFRLGDLTRDSEPDDSARLLMALRKAREEMIVEQMHDVLDQLSHEDLSKATNEQTEILAKLEALKTLLTSTDLDMQMQLDRLRKLNAAIAKLDGAIKEQQRQRDQTARYASQAKTDPKNLTASQQDQRQNRQTTDAIAATLKDLGPAPAKAADVLGNASQSMSLAEGHLGAGRPSDAAALQSDALESMKIVRAQLDQERQKILDELQGQVRKQVIENLQEMLDRQKAVRGATQAVVGQLPSGDAQTMVRVSKLAPSQTAIVRICDETSDLIAQTDFSVALPPALAEIHDSCSSVADRLQTGVANPALVSDEKQIEQDLQDLIDTFKELSSDPGPPSNCRGCKGNKNKLLAELKVLRTLQNRVNAQTMQADVRRANWPTTQPTGELADNIAAIRDRQAAIQTATEQIHQELSGN